MRENLSIREVMQMPDKKPKPPPLKSPPGKTNQPTRDKKLIESEHPKKK